MAELDNMLLPNVMMGINTGEFGAYEGRMSHFGVLNAFYNNTNQLFGADALTRIRAIPFNGPAITIPFLNKYGHTVLTVRTCTINPGEVSATLKSLTRVHFAVDIGVTPAKFVDKYVTAEQALRHQYMMAKRAIYTTLDTMGAAFLDSNKDTTITPGTVHPLYNGVAGAYQISKPVRFYNNLAAIMEENDMTGPYVDVTNTISLADMNELENPGGGALLNTAAIMRRAGIAEMEYSNRVGRGSARTVHFVFPQGAIGLVNFIDYDYAQSPDITALNFSSAGNLSEITAWGQTPDELYNSWNWGVLQKVACVNEQKAFTAKLSADFAFACDSGSGNGESPIKRFEVVETF